MIPYYKSIKELKRIENDISIRFMFQLFQIKTYFSKHIDEFDRSSKRIFLKLTLENANHAALSFIVFSSDYKEIIYESSILVSKLATSTLTAEMLKNTLKADYVKYISKYITYETTTSINDYICFENILANELDLVHILQLMKLSINNVNILTNNNIQLIEINNKLESYFIYKVKYNIPWR